jgi:hypothetical protein
MRQRHVLQAKREAGTILVIALLLMVLLSLLGITLLTVAATEHSVAYNTLVSEGSLMAAEAGVNQGINNLAMDVELSTRVINDTAIGPIYSFRSGRRTDVGPTAPVYLYDYAEEGYDLSKWRFPVYQINATGTALLRNARREVEIQAKYGPVPK